MYVCMYSDLAQVRMYVRTYVHMYVVLLRNVLLYDGPNLLRLQKFEDFPGLNFRSCQL